MEEQEKISSYVAECYAEVNKLKLNDGDYCMIVYSRSVMSGGKFVKFIYKDVVEFEKKVFNDIKSIDEMRAIDFEMWIFD